MFAQVAAQIINTLLAMPNHDNSVSHARNMWRNLKHFETSSIIVLPKCFLKHVCFLKTNFVFATMFPDVGKQKILVEDITFFATIFSSLPYAETFLQILVLC